MEEKTEEKTPEQKTPEQKTPEQKTPEQKAITIRDVTEEGAANNRELRNSKRFHMTWIDDEGVSHTGEFTIQRTTIAETALIGVLMAEARQDKPYSSIDAATNIMHEALAVAQVMVKTKPPWFEPEKMYDERPLLKVREVALEFQNSFRRKSVAK